MDLKLLNNENTVLTLLDVCGSCITDIVYNILFDRAIAIHDKTGKGVAESYRQVIADYIKESNTPKFHSLLLNTIHHYVRMSTVFNTISYPDCISMYASLFVPNMYSKSLTSDQKLNILTMILGNTVREFCNKVLVQYIKCIVDEHQDPINVEILQDAILQIIITQRKGSYDKFIASQVEHNPVVKPTGKIIDKECKTVSKASTVQLTKLTDAFKKSIAKKSAVEKKNKLLIKKNNQLMKQFNELKGMFLKQINLQKEQATIIDELKKQLVSKTKKELTSPKQIKASDNDMDEEYGFKLDTDEPDVETDDDKMFDIQYTDEY